MHMIEAHCSAASQKQRATINAAVMSKSIDATLPHVAELVSALEEQLHPGEGALSFSDSGPSGPSSRPSGGAVARPQQTRDAQHYH
jgi:hypothetical protein